MKEDPFKVINITNWDSRFLQSFFKRCMTLAGFENYKPCEDYMLHLLVKPSHLGHMQMYTRRGSMVITIHLPKECGGRRLAQEFICALRKNAGKTLEVVLPYFPPEWEVTFSPVNPDGHTRPINPDSHMEYPRNVLNSSQ